MDNAGMKTHSQLSQFGYVCLEGKLTASQMLPLFKVQGPDTNESPQFSQSLGLAPDVTC